MSHREVENKDCKECESYFRIVFDPADTSGYPKFCCFCGGSLEDEDDADKLMPDDKDE